MRCFALTTAFLTVMAPVAAQAQEHQHSQFSLGFTNAPGLEDGTSYRLGIKSDWAIGGAFGVQGNLSYRSGDSLSNSTAGLHGYYTFANGTRAGVFYQREALSISGLDVDPTFETVGVEAMLVLAPNARVELFVGEGDIDDFPLALTGYTSYGATAGYDLSPTLRARLGYAVHDLESPFPVGSMSHLDLGLDWYMEGGGSAVPVILTAEVQRADLPFGGDAETSYTLSISIPIGGEPGTAARPLFSDRQVADLFTLYGN